MRTNKSIKYLILLTISSVILFNIYFFEAINPLISIKGLILISNTDKKVEKISDRPLRYISKSRDEFLKQMENKHYDEEGTLSSLFGCMITTFIKDDEIIHMVEKDFFGRYKIYSEPIIKLN